MMQRTWTIRGCTVLAILFLTACASRPTSVTAQGGAGAPANQEKPQIPAGFGTLKQDEFTVQLRSGPLLIKVTPLNENVIRTAAPDTYQRLHNIAESRRAEAARVAGAAGDLELFQVSFFSYEPDVVFQPENLQITHQGRQMRAAAIVALTPGWGRQRLAQQEDQRAIYAFTGKFDYNQNIAVRYGVDQFPDAWSAIVSKLENERVKILARATAK
jgi:hypothetical protein